jgi:glycosidase
VREYIMRIGEHWIREGIDGWRLDVPFEVKTPGFWQEFRDRIKAINPEAYIVGEVWSDAARWLDGTAFDGVMNYEFTGPAIAFAAGDRVQREMVEHHDYWPYPALDAPGYAAKLDRLFGLYDWSIHLAQLNLLDSHDTPRLLTLAGGDRDSLKLALFLMFTFPGAPCIYYGDEVGLAGAHDPDCRRSFPAPEHWDRSLLDLCRELITLRQRFAALRTGDYRTIYAHDSVYAFERNDASDRLVGCVNVDITPASIPIADLSLTASAIHPPLFGTADLGSDHITLPARSFCVLHRNPSA